MSRRAGQVGAPAPGHGWDVPRRGQAGGAAPLALVCILFAFLALAALGAAELARATGDATAARRVAQAALLAAQGALARGEDPRAAMGAVLRANQPDPEATAHLDMTARTLTVTAGWPYRFAFLPLPPRPLEAQASGRRPDPPPER